MSSDHWLVAVEAPIKTALTYSTNKDLYSYLKRGQRVQVPLGKRLCAGLLLKQVELKSVENPQFTVKDISEVDLNYPVLHENFLKWLEWIAEYYFYPVGQVIGLCFPTLAKQTKVRKSSRPPVIKEREGKKAPKLSIEQESVLNGISIDSGFSTNLIFGVTGSGKTEVYLQLLQKILEQGKKGIVLVPEISLTPQLIHRFTERFGDQVAVLHSQLTDRERTNQWWEMVENKKSILIGARSALFCPIQNLGIIVVDEEHEPSYKQDEKLKYHGRDAAIMLGKFMNCPVILGSATPSLESWKNAIDGKYKLFKMNNRVEGRALPNVDVLDLRIEKHDLKQNISQKNKNNLLPHWLSENLYLEIQKNLIEKKQSALFLNRRGVAPLIICQDCGYTYSCPNCDINLTLHGKSHLVCHYCDYHENFKETCPDCKIGEVKPVGLGTESVENELQLLFPGARIARADRDEITNRLEMESLITRMEKDEIDILIGTQMIAKGLDFPSLTLVGILLADIGFNIPDFRSTERSFQLLTQVSGRSGRHVKDGELPGKVIIQTYNTEHPSIVYARENNFEDFATIELENRKALLYPPYGKLISVRFQGRHINYVQQVAKQFSARAAAIKSSNESYQCIEVLGPAEAPLSKIRGNYRYYILLKGTDSKSLNKFCRYVLGQEEWVHNGVRILVDIDPLNLL